MNYGNLGKIIAWDNMEDVNRHDMSDALIAHDFGMGSDPDFRNTQADYGNHTGHIDRDGKHFGIITDRDTNPIQTHIYRHDD